MTGNRREVGRASCIKPQHQRIQLLVALLPPQTNTIIVAAQAFLHILALGTKHMLKVEQSEAFGSINLRNIVA